MVEFIDDRRLGPAFRFLNRHRVVDEKGKVLGYQKLDELREMLAPILLRRTREAVLAQLPPRTTEVVRIAPTEEQLVLHNAHKKVVASIVQKKFISEMDLLRLRMALLMCRLAADSTYLVDKQKPGYSSKLERLDELFERLAAEPTRKVLLFSEWTGMLDLIEPLLERRGLRFVRLDGSVPQKKRAALVHQFQHDSRCTFFLATNAGSTGLNLQAANTVINVDLPWNPAVLEQRVARAHRMGQEQPVHVYVLVTEDTLEDSLLATLGAKKELALAALDPESEVDAVDLASGVEELKRRLEILLGARAEAPLDESEKARVTADAERAGKRDRVAAAAGQMLTAALSFLGELLPVPPAGTQLEAMAAELERGLHDCARRDEQGRISLTLTLPAGAAGNGSANGAELAELALSLARIAAAQGSPTAMPS